LDSLEFGWISAGDYHNFYTDGSYGTAGMPLDAAGNAASSIGRSCETRTGAEIAAHFEVKVESL
jgi:hypothetical protein